MVRYTYRNKNSGHRFAEQNQFVMIQAISFIFNLISLIWRPISLVSIPTFLFVKKQFSLKAIKHIRTSDIGSVYIWTCIRPLCMELDLQCVFYHTTFNLLAFDSFSWLIPINESLMLRVSSCIQFAYTTMVSDMCPTDQYTFNIICSIQNGPI